MKRYFHLSGALCCCLFVFTTHFSSFAQPGSLDPTFGSNGSGKRYVQDLNLFYLANKTLEMPDGKILISGAGTTTGNGNNLSPFVARLLPNGDTDVAFADAGFIRNDVPLSSEVSCWSLIRQPDGKIIQSGRYYNSPNGRYDFYMIRYLENGLLDETFGENNNGVCLRQFPGFQSDLLMTLFFNPTAKL